MSLFCSPTHRRSLLELLLEFLIKFLLQLTRYYSMIQAEHHPYVTNFVRPLAKIPSESIVSASAQRKIDPYQSRGTVEDYLSASSATLLAGVFNRRR